MKYQELIILLPCHSLEDFPIHYEGDDAQALLAAWTAMWHPALMASCQRLPTWARADSPPDNLAERLVIVPKVSESLLLAGWPARAKDQGAQVVRKLSERPRIVAAALEPLDPPAGPLNESLVADFQALGYAYLQEELLTRRMRYMSSLDEVHFRTQAVRAAQGILAGDEAAARAALQGCFDVLAEARERFYPAETHLIDLVLVAPTTIGAALRTELESGARLNLLMSGETLDRLAAQEPATLAALQAAIGRGCVTVAGGELEEREIPLLPPEHVLANVHRGREVFARHLGAPPQVFARRRFGLAPMLPQLLSRSGFVGALHFTLDDGQFPRDGQSRSRWEGADSSAIDSLHRVPLDVTRPESFLRLCEKMGETMDLDHVATLTFARWPGQSSPWFDDLRRVERYAPVFGKFMTLSDYFSRTEAPGQLSKFSSDQYRSPYLKQAIIRRQGDPLSTIARAHAAAGEQLTAQALRVLTCSLRGRVPEPLSADGGRQDAAGPPGPPGDDARWTPSLAGLVSHFAAALPRASAPAESGVLVANVCSTTRRALVELPEGAALPAVEGPVKAVQDTPGPCAVVEVPALGYAWIRPGGQAQRGKVKDIPLADAEELLLRNEFFELLIDPQTGGIRAVRDYNRRGNRWSQQLGFRLPGERGRPGDVWRDPDESAAYSEMVAESVEVTAAGPALGQIVSRGKLIDPAGKVLADFSQATQVIRGSRVIQLQIELDVKEEPRADPWNSYYAARFAWPDEAADLYCGVHQMSQATSAKRIESPYFVEVRTDTRRIAVLTGGWPYHRRIGLRMLDSLLVVRGESARRFRLGIGVDLPQPLPAALELLCPVLAHRETQPPPAGPQASWLFHLDARNVVPTHWQPLVDEQGRVSGISARLQETEGRSIKANLRMFRKPAFARQVDFLGQVLAQLPIDDDRVQIDFAKYEWAQIEVRWNA
jgi:alpha-mannosidase